MRFEDWPTRLIAHVAAAEGRAFQYGTFDCALFACDWILAATGVDHAVEFRGRYDSPLGAARLLPNGGLEAVARRFGGAPLLSPLYAQRGDVALVDTPYGPALAVVVAGGQIARPAAPGGLLMAPLRTARLAWRI